VQNAADDARFLVERLLCTATASAASFVGLSYSFAHSVLIIIISVIIIIIVVVITIIEMVRQRSVNQNRLISPIVDVTGHAALGDGQMR